MSFTHFEITPTHQEQAGLSQLIEIAWGYIDSQNIQRATGACQNLNKQYPDSAQGWFATSFLAFQLHDPKKALISIEKAISIEPKNPKWRAHQAHSYLLIGDKVSALQIISSLIESLTSKIEDAHLCSEIALITNKLGQYQTSISFYQQAIALAPSRGELYFNLASVQRYLGRNNEAEVNLNWALSLNPNDFEAYLQRASLRKQTKEDNHIEQLLGLIDKGISYPIGKAQVCYALAKELEDLKSYEESFKYLTLGASSRRNNMNYDPANDLTGLQHIAKVFNKSFFDKLYANQTKIGAQVNDNNQPIFILGLPRTGSTLVERIVSSHSKVNSAGELNDFALQMMAQVKLIANEPPKSRKALIELTKGLKFNALGDSYIASTKEYGLSGKKFIDKLPLNSLYVGLIHAAMPKAKIIYVKRNPLDTIYAIYKQLFTSGYPFSYDLEELTAYYIEHHKLMLHWQSILPHAIHQVNYEDVIDNVDKEAKRLINYCQLEWEEKCVSFHQNKAPSTTASASQVREKIYTSSSGKWRHYESQLETVKQKLIDAGMWSEIDPKTNEYYI